MEGKAMLPYFSRGSDPAATDSNHAEDHTAKWQHRNKTAANIAQIGVEQYSVSCEKIFQSIFYVVIYFF